MCSSSKKTSDRKQKRRVLKERCFRALERNSLTSALPLILNGSSLTCWQVAHVFTQVLDLGGGRLRLLFRPLLKTPTEHTEYFNFINNQKSLLLCFNTLSGRRDHFDWFQEEFPVQGIVVKPGNKILN